MLQKWSKCDFLKAFFFCLKKKSYLFKNLSTDLYENLHVVFDVYDKSKNIGIL